MRALVALLLAASVACACSNGQAPAFTLTSASVDSTFRCATNANNAPYDVHATVAVHNGTSSAVAITGVKAQMTLERVSGSWLEKVGDAYDAGSATFAPASVGAGSAATLQITFQSACTSPAHGSGPSSYGDYRITLHVATSHGSYSISTSNLHRIMAA